LSRWKSQLKETGTLEPRRRKETWRKIYPKKLKQYNDEHPDAYLEEIAKAFGCTETAVRKAFKRTNIVAGICEGQWVAPLQYNGTTDSILFEYWFNNCLMKEIASCSVTI